MRLPRDLPNRADFDASSDLLATLRIDAAAYGIDAVGRDLVEVDQLVADSRCTAFSQRQVVARASGRAGVAADNDVDARVRFQVLGCIANDALEVGRNAG